MKLSIIVPLYNQEEYIEEALKGLHLQTVTDAEFIVIDDGSTDKSATVVKLYCAKDIRFKYFKYENGGYGKACNLGLGLATGDYIMILEPDDFYINNNICKEIIDYMETVKCDFAKFLTISRKKNNFSSLYSFKNLPDILTDKKDIYKLYSKCPPTIWANCYNKKFLKTNNIRFFETPGASYQDNFFIAAVFLHVKKIGLLNKVGIFYRDDNNNSSSAKRHKILRLKYYVIQFNCFIKKYGFHWNYFYLLFLNHFFRSITWLTEDKDISYSDYIVIYEELHKLPKGLYKFIAQFIFYNKKYSLLSIFFKKKLSRIGFYFIITVLRFKF